MLKHIKVPRADNLKCQEGWSVSEKKGYFIYCYVTEALKDIMKLDWPLFMIAVVDLNFAKTPDKYLNYNLTHVFFAVLPVPV